MSLAFLENIDVYNKAVLVRVDLNVPMQNGQILDDMRLTRIKATIDILIERGAKILLLSHFGRPKAESSAAYSLKQVLCHLEQVLGSKVAFFPQLLGPDREPLMENVKAIEAMAPGEIALFENTRFYEGELQNDPLFAKAIATYGCFFVNDAFSASHRAHATVDKITDFLPSYPGIALQKELNILETALKDAQKPVTAIIGGAKISTKIHLLENLVSKVDNIVIGGAMANSFLAQQGVDMGRSLVEPDAQTIIERLMARAKEYDCHLILPFDGVMAAHFAAHAQHQVANVKEIGPDMMMLDLGPLSIAAIEKTIAQSKTVLWNGPLGAFEFEPFDRATLAIARYIAQKCRDNALLAIAGGGDTLAALQKAGVRDEFSYVSTAGGAFLEWLEGKSLPGIKALER